ncbi:MAG: ATP-binding protein [Methanosarcina sp.]
MFRRLISGFSKHISHLPLEKQITAHVILMLSITSIVTGFVNTVLGFPAWYQILIFFEGFLGFSVIITGYVRRDDTLIKLLFVLNLYLIAIVSWPYNAGIDGPVSLYIFAIPIFCMGVFGRYSLIHYILNFALIVSLVLVSYKYPGIIRFRYENDGMRIADLLTTYFIMGLSVISVIVKVIGKYRGAMESAGQNELKFKTLFSTSPDPVFIMERSTGRINDINEKVLSVYGYEREELIGQLNTIVSAEPEQTTDKTKNPEVFIPLRYHKRKNGEVFPTEISAETITINNNEFIIASIRDISKRVRDEQEKRKAMVLLQENEARYRQSNEDKNKFFSILSHDLRGPFSSLLGFSDMLLRNIDKYDSAKIKTHVEYINEISNNTYNLLEDLLLWSGSQSGNLKFEPSRIIVSDLFKGMIRTMSPSIGNKKISLSYNADENDSVFGDIDMLNTVLRNLISNSIKFTHEGGEILLSYKELENSSLISVSDNGIGIPEKDQAKLWNITTTYTVKGTNGETGTGMGLILCKDFIEKHGGKIWVESKTGQGCTFKITLPSNS